MSSTHEDTSATAGVTAPVIVPTSDPADSRPGASSRRQPAPGRRPKGSSAPVRTLRAMLGARALRRLGVVLAGLGTLVAVFAGGAGATVHHRKAHRTPRTHGRRI